MSLQYVSQRALVFMSTQFPKFNKALATPATPVSVVVCVVNDNVILHACLTREPGWTEGAAVWSLARVRSQVVGEVLPCNETG